MRAAVRELVARRLSSELAALLLPVLAGEGPLDPRHPVVLGGKTPWPQLAASYADLLAPAQRKQRGTWFTAMELARPTARRALAPLLGERLQAPLRIVDPAVGGGTFLLAALHEMRSAGASATLAAACLHGVDLDATATALAALAVWEAAELPMDQLPEIAARIPTGNGLQQGRIGSFDAVLTNPPWETLQAHAEAAAQVAALRPHFHHQGSGKLYTYRLFVERAFQLVRDGGRYGLIVPASLWFDRDARPVRDLLLDQGTWEWLYGFENTQKLFAIDSRYRFAAIVGGKGGRTEAVRVAFGRTALADWAAPAPHHTRYERAQIAALSPNSRTFVEVEDARDLALLQRLQQHSVPLLGRDGAFAWRQGDFNMTSDRPHFVLRSAAEADGWRRGDDGRWQRGASDAVLLPLYQGAMVYDLHPNAAAHAGGTGFQTAWEEPQRLDDLRPAYLVAETLWAARRGQRPGACVVLRTLSNATNERSAVACLLPEVPCGNSLGVLIPRANEGRPLLTMAAGAAVLGSLPFDWALRLRLTGTNLNGFLLEECRLPRLGEAAERELAQCALQLCAVLPWHAGLWAIARQEGWAPDGRGATRAGLLTRIDVLVGTAYGLRPDDVRWIVRGSDLPSARIGRKPPSECHPKGFWRIDREAPPAARRPNRWLAAAATADPHR